jgi:hypothetical protein
MKRIIPTTSIHENEIVINIPINGNTIIDQNQNSFIIKLNFVSSLKIIENEKKIIDENGSKFNEFHSRARARTKKEKKIIKKEKRDTYDLFLDMFDDSWQSNESFQTSLRDFVNHRKEIRKSLTPLACQRLATKLSKYKFPVVMEAIDQSITNGWIGIFPESIDKNAKGSKRKFQSPFKEWDGRRYYLQPNGEYRNKSGSLFIE